MVTVSPQYGQVTVADVSAVPSPNGKSSSSSESSIHTRLDTDHHRETNVTLCLGTEEARVGKLCVKLVAEVLDIECELVGYPSGPEEDRTRASRVNHE